MIMLVFCLVYVVVVAGVCIAMIMAVPRLVQIRRDMDAATRAIEAENERARERLRRHGLDV